ncbi:MucR family transcriptional regulator [Methylobacterium sp. J-026]|uniref:MucR family transcriptional regulator n=1 Tax=Methylobacterium sp. J-026 TaxID=2836624 RepID=UPI0028C3C2FE|nr:MucR family transcriptional regulator [Methylobacterium sp. J-026]
MPSATLTPAQIQRSISLDTLMSFEDGKSYASLKRHLTRLGLTPQAYREKWGLPRDYPMVAQSYSDRCSSTARRHKLGLKPKEPSPTCVSGATADRR